MKGLVFDAEAVKAGVSLKEIDVPALQALLKSSGAYLD